MRWCGPPPPMVTPWTLGGRAGMPKRTTRSVRAANAKDGGRLWSTVPMVMGCAEPQAVLAGYLQPHVLVVDEVGYLSYD